MIKLTEIRGLKYPDEFVTRYFFKKQFHQRHGRVLELGCGNGNNLMLFYQHGWDVVGIDISEKALDDAKHNFQGIGEEDTRWLFRQLDLGQGLPKIDELFGPFDVVLMPSVLYYIPRRAVISCLTSVLDLLAPDGSFFLRMRAIGDYRYGRGRQIERNGFVLEISETGEGGLINVFYHQYELVDMLREYLQVDMDSLRVLSVSFDNVQNDVVTNNKDVIIWGKVKKQ